MPVDEKSLEKALAAIKQKYGEDMVRTGDSYDDPPRIPTGLIPLDSITGGGIPMGRYTQFYGPYSAGKTMVAWKVAAEAQKMGLSVAYYDVENQFDKDWVSGLGVDPSKVHVIDTNIIDVVGESLEALLHGVNIHIIDSVAMGITREEASTDIDEYRMASSTRIWDKVLRRSNSHFSKEDNMVIFINQSREVFGRQGIERPWGGRQLGHISSVILGFNKSSMLYRDSKGNLSKDGEKIDKETGVRHEAGMEIVIKVEKARKMDVQQFAACRARLEFGKIGKFDEAWNLTRAAMFNGFVEKSGSWFTLPDGERVQGENQLKEYIINNPEFAVAVKKSLLRSTIKDELDS